MDGGVEPKKGGGEPRSSWFSWAKLENISPSVQKQSFLSTWCYDERFYWSLQPILSLLSLAKHHLRKTLVRHFYLLTARLNWFHFFYSCGGNVCYPILVGPSLECSAKDFCSYYLHYPKAIDSKDHLDCYNDKHTVRPNIPSHCHYPDVSSIVKSLCHGRRCLSTMIHYRTVSSAITSTATVPGGIVMR